MAPTSDENMIPWAYKIIVLNDFGRYRKVDGVLELAKRDLELGNDAPDMGKNTLEASIRWGQSE